MQVNTSFIRDLEYNARVLRGIPGRYKQFIVLDLDGISMAHLREKFRNPTMAILRMLQDRFPEAVHHIMIVNTPLLFRMAWKGIKVFIDKNTQNNITMLAGNRKEWAGVFTEKGACSHTPCQYVSIHSVSDMHVVHTRAYEIAHVCASDIASHGMYIRPV